MLRRIPVFLALAAVPALAAAQSNPVADAFRANAARAGKNLIASAEEMPASKYGYKPTKAQMTFGQIVDHLSEGNDAFCGAIAGVKAPERTKITVKDGKEKQVARLKETFAFCDSVLTKLTDANLGEELEPFEHFKMSRAGVEFVTVGDWADHYSQFANYLRLNGILPPTAKRSVAQGQKAGKK